MLRALEFAGLSELIERLPGGLDSPVGRQGGLLSAGERQLVALARLALRDPAVILLDESTSRIDDGSEVTLGESLRRLGIGRSLIVIAHRPSTIAMADEVMELRDGKLLAVKTASDEPA
jgi:ATP-binding cassette subfamily B protein